MIIRPAPPDHFAWIASRANLVPSAQFGALEAVDEAGRIHGMMGFDAWLPNSVTMSIALENPACFRSLLRPSFGIVFNGTGRNVAVAAVLSTNKRSLELVEHVGFREVHRGWDWWEPGVHLVFFEMRRIDCKWLPKETAS